MFKWESIATVILQDLRKVAGTDLRIQTGTLSERLPTQSLRLHGCLTIRAPEVCIWSAVRIISVNEWRSIWIQQVLITMWNYWVWSLGSQENVQENMDVSTNAKHWVWLNTNDIHLYMGRRKGQQQTATQWWSRMNRTNTRFCEHFNCPRTQREAVGKRQLLWLSWFR